MDKTKIAVFVSGGGTNLQALIDAETSGILTSGEIVLVVASNPEAYALERAKKAGIPGVVCSRKALGSQEAFEAAISEQLTEQDRRILRMHYDEDMTYRQTADALGISPSAVNKHIRKSLSKIRAVLRFAK